MWGQLSTICSNVLTQPNGELLVAVNHNQLQTMASETVDKIDWSHPPPSWVVPPERHVHSINQSNLSGTRTCNRSMRGNHLANATTQSMGLCLFPCGYWCSKRCFELLNVTMVFEFLIFIGIEFHSFTPDTETAFCPTAVLR